MTKREPVKCCENCSLWSELVASSDGDNVLALCESRVSQYSMCYTTASQTCEYWGVVPKWDKHNG